MLILFPIIRQNNLYMNLPHANLLSNPGSPWSKGSRWREEASKRARRKYPG
jgi:hypothetical protein